MMRRFLWIVLALLGAVAALAFFTSGRADRAGEGAGRIVSDGARGMGGFWRGLWGGGAGGGGGERVAATVAPSGNCPGDALGASIGGPFTLVNPQGRPVTSESLKGLPLLIYFGYTFCPDICPTGLSTMSEAVEILEAKGALVAPVFITVDPERDTPAVMGAYVEHFHKRMIGLTGTLEQTDAAAKAYKVYYSKRKDPDFSNGYSVDHTGFIYLVDARGDFRAFFRHGDSGAAIAEGVMCHLAKGPKA